MARLGIDVGTWSVAAMLAERAGGRRQVVPDPVTGLPWSRCSVARGPAGGWLVGESAEQIRPLREGLYRDDIKRLLDSDEPVYLDGAPYRVEELLAQIIGQRVAQAWTMTQESVDELVLGIPTSFEGTRAEAVREAAQLAGFRGERVSLVAEPVAAARAALRGLQGTGTFLVFDLGGGTFDSALLTAQAGAVQVIDSSGDSGIGGFRIDEAIVGHLRARYSFPERADSADRLGASDLLAASRTMKHQLSQDTTAYARNPFPGGERELTLTRSDLERLAQPVMTAAIACCENLLKANSLGWTDLTATIATGGATRSPVIARRLESVTRLTAPPQPPEMVTVEGLLPPGERPRIHARRLPAIRSIHTLSGPPAAFNAVAFSPDGALIAAGSDDHSVRIWDTATGNPYGRPLAGPAGHAGKVLAVAFSPDGSLLASAGADKAVRLWDVATLTLRGTPIVGGIGQVHALVFTVSKGKPALAAAGDARKARLWDPATADLLQQLEVPSGSLTSLAAWPERDVLVASGETSPQVGVWHVATEWLHLWEFESRGVENLEITRSESPIAVSQIKADWPRLYLTGLHYPATGLLGVALSPDGATVATGSRSGTVRVWKLDQGTETSIVLTGHRGQVTGVAFSPDGSLLASAGGSLRVWEPATRVSRILTDHTAALTGVQFSPDGSLLATSSRDNTVRIWAVD
jgi:molecular chaperone DnaK